MDGSCIAFRVDLPIPFLELRTREIDTVNDYERAVEWVRNNFRE